MIVSDKNEKEMNFYVPEFQKLLLKWEGPKRFLIYRYSQPMSRKCVPTHSPQGHTS